MVISVGCFWRSRSESFTPSCRLLTAMKKWWSAGSPVRWARSRASRTTRLKASCTRRSYRIRSSAMAPAAKSIPETPAYPENKVQASVARCLRTPPEEAKLQGFDLGQVKLLAQPEREAQHSCHCWQLLFRPDNGGTMPGKSSPFTPSSILFHPHQMPPGPGWRNVVEVPGTAPGSDRFITMAV